MFGKKQLEKYIDLKGFPFGVSELHWNFLQLSFVWLLLEHIGVCLLENPCDSARPGERSCGETFDSGGGRHELRVDETSGRLRLPGLYQSLLEAENKPVGQL